MTNIVQRGVITLVENGLIELVVFALVFVITYGIMRKTHLFAPGKDDDDRKKNLQKLKPVHTILSLAMGALVILPHFMAPGSSYDIIPVLEKSLPQLSFLLVAVLCALILLGFFGLSLGHGSGKGNPLKLFVFLISIGFIVWIFGSNMNWWRNPWANIFTPDVVAVVIAVLVFAMVIVFIMGDSEKKYKNFGDFLTDHKKDDFNSWDETKFAHKLHDFVQGKK